MNSLLLIPFPIVYKQAYFSLRLNNHPLTFDINSSILQLCSRKTLVYTHNIRFNVSHLFYKTLRLFLLEHTTKIGIKNVTSAILSVSESLILIGLLGHMKTL